MTHAELVDRAVRWLKNTAHCSVVAKELVAYTESRETPDAIGWVNNRSILIECKVSRSDFVADHMKASRLGGPALGDWRFYFTPPGLLQPSQLTEGWGLYEVHERTIRHAGGLKYRNAAFAPFQSHKPSEIAMLLSMVRRCCEWGRPTISTNKIEYEPAEPLEDQ